MRLPSFMSKPLAVGREQARRSVPAILAPELPGLLVLVNSASG
jgi:hypothetical protein